MELCEKPFAALFLSDWEGGENKTRLLFLTLAYLLSEHIPFVFPISSEKCHFVDRQFDEVLKGLLLNSKGIIYQKDLATEQLSKLLGQASLLLTDADGATLLTNETTPPRILLQPNGEGIQAQLYGLDKLADVDLKSQIIGCVRLINVLSNGFPSRGHFSLSW